MSALPVVITKSELKDLMAHGSFTLIDVREKSETDLGRIPGAKLAPVATLLNTLQDPEAFQQSFGFPRPELDARVVFYCRSGARAGRALEYARKLGFVNSQNYQGSFSEWSSTETNIEK